MMRIIAHWEGRVPVLSPSGTFTVVMMGVLSGTLAGFIHGLLRRFVHNEALRIPAFFIFCTLFTIRGVHGLLLRPKLLFIALTLVYCIIVELTMRRNEQSDPSEVLPPLAA